MASEKDLTKHWSEKYRYPEDLIRKLDKLPRKKVYVEDLSPSLDGYQEIWKNLPSGWESQSMFAQSFTGPGWFPGEVSLGKTEIIVGSFVFRSDRKEIRVKGQARTYEVLIYEDHQWGPDHKIVVIPGPWLDDAAEIVDELFSRIEGSMEEAEKLVQFMNEKRERENKIMEEHVALLWTEEREKNQGKIK